MASAAVSASSGGVPDAAVPGAPKMAASIRAFEIGEFAGATYTPMSEDGLTVNLDAIGAYASFLASKGLHVVFINGTSGESMSLSQAERKAVTERWVEEGKKQSPRIRVVAHIGCDSLSATRELARHAEEVGADAISAMTPIMFKPANVTDLANWIKLVCEAAPATPFYYYNFPVITGVGLDAAKLLAAVEEVGIPQFRGFKFTDFNLFAFECCKAFSGGAYEVCYGRDEAALGGMATGATAHIGNGFCFMMGPFRRMREAFRAGDLATARKEQRRVNQVVTLIFDSDVGAPVAVSKAIQTLRGVDMGPARLPIRAMDEAKMTLLRSKLEAMDFFAWCD